MEILAKLPPEFEEIRGTAAKEWLKEGFEAGEKKGGKNASRETPAGFYWPWSRTDSACFRPV